MYFNFGKRIFEDLESYSESLALISTEQSLTWAQLHSTCTKIVNILTSLNIPKQHPIFVKSNDSPMQAAVFLACVIGEYVYVPIHSTTPKSRLNKLKDILRSEVLIQWGNEDHDFNFDLQVNDFNISVTQKSKLSKLSSLNKDVIYTIFTSGSSGEPKAVPITIQNMLSFLQYLEDCDTRVLANDQIINTLTFNFDGSFLALLPALQAGACIILCTPNTEIEPLLNLVKPTIWCGTPSALKIALVSSKLIYSNQIAPKSFWIGGETLPSYLIEKLWKLLPNSDIINFYGPTEATVSACNCKITKDMLNKYSDNLPIGSKHYKKYINLINTFKDDNLTIGEIEIFGNTVSSGYLNATESNAKSFYKLINSNSQAFKTGDLAYTDGDYLFYKGRIDSQIKLNGFRIDLNEIEKIALTCELIKACACISLKSNEGKAQKIACFFVLKELTTDTEEQATKAVKAHLELYLPSYMLPSDYICIDQIPHTPNFKIDQQRLLKIYHAKTM